MFQLKGHLQAVIKYNKEGVIKMGKVCLICKQIKYPLVGSSTSQYFSELLYAKSSILKTWNSENCKTLSSSYQVGLFLISCFRHVLSVLFFLLGDSVASEFYVLTFQNTLFHLHRWCNQEE